MPAENKIQTQAVIDNEKPGMLGKIAASILMGLLYAPRMARFDLLRVTCRLATRTTTWTEMDDKRLFKIICYVHSTLEAKLCLLCELSFPLSFCVFACVVKIKSQ